MTQAEMRLIEEGWDALVERLGLAEATRFVMLLDRRTGGALQHLRALWSAPIAGQQRRPAGAAQGQPLNQLDA
jgi:hypothetical protein